MIKKNRLRILVTRTDRLGDVILATPVLALLKRLYPEAHLSFLVQKTWMPVLQYGDAVELIEYDPEESEIALSIRLKAKNFDRAYVIRDEKTVTRAVKMAEIPFRIGPYSSLRSIFSFNRGRFQKRSRCRMHEAEYNLDLVKPVIPALDAAHLPKAWVETLGEAKQKAKAFLEKQGLHSKQFYVIHPGSSGSARYVKQEALYLLAKKLILSGHEVCISGGPGEEVLLTQFSQAVPKVKVLGGLTSIGLDGLAEVYRHAKAVVAHGTGPLHLAAAVGAPVIAIFPPIFVLSEKRWGPLSEKRSVWVPGVPCPAIYQCLGEKCRYYDCMDLFDVNQILKQLEIITS